MLRFSRSAGEEEVLQLRWCWALAFFVPAAIGVKIAQDSFGGGVFQVGVWSVAFRHFYDFSVHRLKVNWCEAAEFLSFWWVAVKGQESTFHVLDGVRAVCVRGDTAPTQESFVLRGFFVIVLSVFLGCPVEGVGVRIWFHFRCCVVMLGAECARVLVVDL